MSDSVTPWTVAHQASLSMRFFRQEYWGGLPSPSPGDLLMLSLKWLSWAGASLPEGECCPFCSLIHNVSCFPSSAINPHHDLVLRGGAVCAWLTGEHPSTTRGHIEEYTMCELAHCDMSETIRDVTPYIYDHRHRVIGIYRLCRVFPMEYNRIQPIIWAFLVSLALPIWRSRLENPATVYLSLTKGWTSCITRERIFWINWTFPWKPCLIDLPYKGQFLSENAFTSGKVTHLICPDLDLIRRVGIKIKLANSVLHKQLWLRNLQRGLRVFNALNLRT